MITTSRMDKVMVIGVHSNTSATITITMMITAMATAYITSLSAVKVFTAAVWYLGM